MKIKTYWITLELDDKRHDWVNYVYGYGYPTKKFIDFDIPDNSTAEYIEDFCKRKDVILINTQAK